MYVQCVSLLAVSIHVLYLLAVGVGYTVRTLKDIQVCAMYMYMLAMAISTKTIGGYKTECLLGQ